MVASPHGNTVVAGFTPYLGLEAGKYQLMHVSSNGAQLKQTMCMRVSQLGNMVNWTAHVGLPGNWPDWPVTQAMETVSMGGSGIGISCQTWYWVYILLHDPFF
jgi:hypothetical protein